VAELRSVGSFLSSLGGEDLAALAALGRHRTYRRGDWLFLEGTPSDAVYIVHAGRARVFTATAEGNEVTLSVRGPGDLIGEMGALDPGSLRSASVVALDPLRCQVVPAAELQAFLATHPRVTLAVLQLLIGRLRDADRRRTEFGSYNTTRRLARILVEAADAAGRRSGSAAQETGTGLALSQRELAGLIGASRESVARALAELRGRGLVLTGRRVITVCDAAGLRRFAD
jgi:CRP/FNR family transcriptional regulator, cyclic AMP receptor protein